MHLLVCNSNCIITNKRHPPRDHFVHHHSKRINITSRIWLRTLCLFGREVCSSAHHRTRLCQAVFNCGTERSRNTKVSNFHLAHGSNQDISRLNIAMNYTIFVCKTQSACDINRNITGLSGIETQFFFQDARQCSSLHKLHCNEVGVIDFPPVIYRNDVGMSEPSSRLSLSTKALNKVWIIGILSEQNL